MRYLKNLETGKVTEVSDDDDKKFYALIGERQDGRPVYVQTGAHDPAVTSVEVKDETTAELEKQSGAELVTPNETSKATAKAEA